MEIRCGVMTITAVMRLQRLGYFCFARIERDGSGVCGCAPHAPGIAGVFFF